MGRLCHNTGVLPGDMILHTAMLRKNDSKPQRPPPHSALLDPPHMGQVCRLPLKSGILSVHQPTGEEEMGGQQVITPQTFDIPVMGV